MKPIGLPKLALVGWQQQTAKTVQNNSNDSPSIDIVADDADRKLLKSISQCQSHVLRHILNEMPTHVRSI